MSETALARIEALAEDNTRLRMMLAEVKCALPFLPSGSEDRRTAEAAMLVDRIATVLNRPNPIHQ